MISLNRLFSKGDVFFELLEASAEEARASVKALVDIIRQPGELPSLEEFARMRREDKRLRQQLSDELARTFITPIDREDIEALSHVLYRIPKTVEKFAERLIIGSNRLGRVDFSRHVILLDEAAAIIVEMVRALRRRADIDTVREQNRKLQQIEGEADKLMLALLTEVYSGRYDPFQAMLLRDLYELLEKIIDRCRDAGNVITQIVLKHS